MSVKNWMLVYSDDAPIEVLGSDPVIDREASVALAKRLFPNERLGAIEGGDLCSTHPLEDELLVGCFHHGLSVVSAREFALDRPSQLPRRFIDPAFGSTLRLHAMDGSVDWTAFAVWHHGKLERSLSVSSMRGVLEDIGDPLPFEMPFWHGRHAVAQRGAGPLGFHPIILGDEALLAFFDYQLEGAIAPAACEPGQTPLMRFRRTPMVAAEAEERSWWKVW